MGWLNLGIKLLPVIITAVQAVERLAGAKKGKDKQDAAIGLVGDIVPFLEASIGRDVVSEAAVQDEIRKVIDAYVGLENVIADIKAKRAA
jgi:hypothetical protein